MSGIYHRIDGVTYCPPDLAQRYFASNAWVDSTLGDALRATAARVPERAAYLSDEATLTFAALDMRSERLGAALIELGLRPGDRAIFQMGTCVDTVIALMGAYKAGVVPVCAVPQYREIEIGQLVSQSEARGYFVQADFSAFDLVGFAHRMMARHPSLEHLLVARGEQRTHADAGYHAIDRLIHAMPPERARAVLADIRIGSEDVLSFQLSGGTTGVPKIIPRFHAEYIGHSLTWMRHIGMTEHSRMIWSLPLLHNAGQLYVLASTVATGMTTVLMPRVDIARMLTLIETHRVTHGLSIGPVAPQMIAYKDVGKHDLSSLQLFGTMSRADSLEAHLGVPCFNLYGTTEGLLMGAGAHLPAALRHHTQGLSGCDDDDIRVLFPGTDTPAGEGAAGELCFRGPSSLRGYYKAPEATAQTLTPDGFVRTGDMVTEKVIDGIRCFAFEGRLRDNINRGGEKIGCEEVEAFVSHHPAVADAKLVAMPDPVYGERGCVYLILRPGHAAPSVTELAEFLVGHGLAKFKCPERIETVDEFPVTRVGKVDKAALRAAIAGRLAAESAPTGTVRPAKENA
ncbi:AMP-binding protein [Pandoraea apista]|uniref:AMP-binding protein n=1 Tax=Pandoraea apista TaxID=93218 RepID=UPI0006582092|nr:AMP-binding protein [Pandoraea apista]ALS64776.1 2,3-dihydroxybenzoate-AMP ligase [Pandoraea apista]AVF41359.1 2,3-dihydroxybenzoate-AMP ligase [Pandoraea apista]RRW91422.1 (2,3-dihydroxybenzoyl)adenylate synthase [Pandoraea apista]RRX00908.1 (2,3-dihydroxybenzoyl)adenylate synthase [Pandoraea apista]CFB64995.1 2,3-dihydroxybenzoate-AMP ligase [Pandoraea apista]